MARPRRANLGHGATGSRLRRVGGHPAVDFANTVDNDRPLPESLTDYEALLDWSDVGKVVSHKERTALARLAGKHPRSASHWVGEALAVRRLAMRLFAARAHGRRASARDLDELNAWLAKATPVPALAASGLSYLPDRAGEETELAEPVRRILVLLAGFLVSPDFAHVRQCEGDNCGWYFIDRSPSKRRRWCSMAGCGNRVKAQRHYRRLRGKP